MTKRIGLKSLRLCTTVERFSLAPCLSAYDDSGREGPGISVVWQRILMRSPESMARLVSGFLVILLRPLIVGRHADAAAQGVEDSKSNVSNVSTTSVM